MACCLSSRPVRIDQVIPSLASRDAIGVHTVNLTEALRGAGIESEIYYGTCTPDMATLAHPISALSHRGGRRERFLLYQASIGSPVFDTLVACEEPILVNYHNITPSRLLAAWEPAVAYETSLGRAQLERLAPRSLLAIADSHFNELELTDAGYEATAVAPLLIDMTRAAPAPDPLVAKKLGEQKTEGGVDLLFVGKVSPHKAPHDLVKALAVLRKLYDPRARLHLVGSPLGDHYARALGHFVHELGLDAAVEVTGSIDEPSLEAYYRAADVFVCASDHEGFCVPVVEAMGHGIPVVAYGSSAIPETVGSGGVVLPTKDPLRFAAAIWRMCTDETLRARTQAAARLRVSSLTLERGAARHVELLRGAAERAPASAG